MKTNKLFKSVALAAISSCVAFNAAAERFILAQAYPNDHIFNFAAETFMQELKETGSDYTPQYHIQAVSPIYSVFCRLIIHCLIFLSISLKYKFTF